VDGGISDMRNRNPAYEQSDDDVDTAINEVLVRLEENISTVRF